MPEEKEIPFNGNIVIDKDKNEVNFTVRVTKEMLKSCLEALETKD